MKKKTKKKKVVAECEACDGTGLFRGMEEQEEGVAVICLVCNGTGKVTIQFIPFTRRKVRKDITKVYLSLGANLLTGMGRGKKSITYKEFTSGKFPKE